MDALDDFEEEEEVDYDFNLDDDFLNEGLDEEEQAQEPKPALSPAAATIPAKASEQPRQEAAQLEKPGPRAQPAAPQTVSATKQNSQKDSSSDRKRVPIPIPKPVGNALAASTTDSGTAKGMGQQANGKTLQKLPMPKSNLQGGLPLPKGNPQGRGQINGRGRGGQFAGRHVLEGQLQARWGNFQQQLPARHGDIRPPGMMQNGPGMGMRFSQGLPSGPPMLPMPPGLPMPDMGMPMPPINNMGIHRRMEDGFARLGNRVGDAGTAARETERPDFGRSKGPNALRFPPTHDLHHHPGHGEMSLAHGMDAQRDDRAARNSQSEAARESKKRVWDRLGPVPQLAGDFDAGEEFEPPKKRFSPENRTRPLPGRVLQHAEPGIKLQPMMPTGLHPGLPMPGGVPPRDPAAEAAEKAKKEAEAQRLADIQKQIEAQKLENSLLSKMQLLKKQEQIATLQEQIARLEAAEKSRQAAAAARAAAAQKQAASKTRTAKLVANPPKPEPVPAEEPPAVSPSKPAKAAQAQPRPVRNLQSLVRKLSRSSTPEVQELPAAKTATRLRSSIVRAGSHEETASNKRRMPSADRQRLGDEEDWDAPEQWGEPRPGKSSGDLREFLSLQRAKKRGSESGPAKAKRPAFGNPFRTSRDSTR